MFDASENIFSVDRVVFTCHHLFTQFCFQTLRGLNVKQKWLPPFFFFCLLLTSFFAREIILKDHEMLKATLRTRPLVGEISICVKGISIFTLIFLPFRDIVIRFIFLNKEPIRARLI